MSSTIQSRPGKSIAKPATQSDIKRFEPVEELATPRAAITAAIGAADYASTGAPFNPFLMKFANATDFNDIWNADRGPYVEFWQYNGQRTDGFLPLGDIALVGGVSGPIAQTPIMLLAPNAENGGALAHPLSFTFILNDHGSGNDADVAYWWPVAPPGYQAVGLCVTNGAVPNPSNYWCVADAYLQSAGVSPYWNDSGSHWQANGSLSRPSLTDTPASGSMLLTPTTILSNQQMDGGGQYSFCLVVEKLFLTVPGATSPLPTYSDSYGYGWTTSQGIVQVAVLPASVITDSNLGAQPATTPFYYLAGQPYWECTSAFPSPNGGEYTAGYIVGTSSVVSKSFQETNSVTVGADVGIEAGEKGGFSAHMSVSYTHEMQIAQSSQAGNNTEVSQSLKLNLPVSQRVLVWQKTVEFVTYRTNGQVLSDAPYQTTEITFTAK